MKSLVLVALVGCTSSKYEPPPEPAPDPEPAPLARFAHDVAVKPPDLFAISSALEDAVKADGAAKVAPIVSGPLLANWELIDGQELVYAHRLGTERAQGKSPANCYECTVFGRVMDTLAPHDSKLAAKWADLKPRMAAVEQSAYEDEANNKRPRVIVWSEVDANNPDAALVSDCVVAALRTSYPDRKWLLEWAAPAADTPSIELVVTMTSDEYIDSLTHQRAAALASGLRVALKPHALPSRLAIRPVEVAVSVKSPSEIKSDLNVAPTMEVTRAGMSQMEALRDEACTKIAADLKASATRHARR